jgi:plastocyanin
MKNLKWLAIATALLLVLLVGTLLMNHNNNKDKTITAPPPRTAKIYITAQGFQPTTITIKTGTTITWRNNDQTAHRIASNPHPEHTDLKGLYSGLLNEQDTYSYTYNTVGSYNYHDETNPTTNGTVVVKE